MVVGRWQWVVGRWQVLGTHYQLPTTIYQLKPMQSQIVNRKIANAKASPSPCMAREGRACRDRQREGRACRDRKRRWENGLRSGDMSPLHTTTYISTLLHGQGHSPRRRGRRRHNAARRRGRTPLATACAAHFVRGICRHVWAVATSATLPHFSPNQSPNP